MYVLSVLGYVGCVAVTTTCTDFASESKCEGQLCASNPYFCVWSGSTGCSCPTQCDAYDGKEELCTQSICPELTDKDVMAFCHYDKSSGACKCSSAGATPTDAPTTVAPMLAGCAPHKDNEKDCTSSACAADGAMSCVYDSASRACMCPTAAPNTPAPDTPAPSTPAPDTPAPSTPAPDTPAPDTPAPSTPAPQTSVPATPSPSSTTVTGNVTGGGSVTVGGGNTTTVTGNVTGGGTVTVGGGNSTTVTGNVTGGGTVTVGGGNSTTVTGNVTGGGTVTVGGGNSTTVTGNVTGGGSVTVGGGNTTTVTGNVTGGGTVTVGGGNSTTVTGNVTGGGNVTVGRTNTSAPSSPETTVPTESPEPVDCARHKASPETCVASRCAEDSKAFCTYHAESRVCACPTSAPETKAPTPETSTPSVPTTNAPLTVEDVDWCDVDADCRTYDDSAATCVESKCVCTESEGFVNPVTKKTKETLFICVQPTKKGNVKLRLEWNVDCEQSNGAIEGAVRTAIEETTKGRTDTLVRSCGSTIFVVDVEDADITTVATEDMSELIVASLKKNEAAVAAGFATPMTVGSSLVPTLKCSAAGATEMVLVNGGCVALACESGYLLSSGSCVEDDDSDDTLSTGAIVGIVLGCTAFVVMIIAVAAFFLCKGSKAEDTVCHPPHHTSTHCRPQLSSQKPTEPAFENKTSPKSAV